MLGMHQEREGLRTLYHARVTTNLKLVINDEGGCTLCDDKMPFHLLGSRGCIQTHKHLAKNAAFRDSTFESSFHSKPYHMPHPEEWF